MFAEPAGGPLAELCAPQGLDAIPDRDNDVEIEVLDLPDHPPLALTPNCCKFCKGCLAFELPLAVGVADVSAHDGKIALEELGHLVKRQPDGFLFQAHIQRDLAVRGLINDDLAARAGFADVSHSAGSVSLRRYSLVREIVIRCGRRWKLTTPVDGNFLESRSPQ